MREKKGSEPGFADDLLYFDIKEVEDVGRLQDQCGVGAPSGSTYGDDFLRHADEAGAGSGYGDLSSHLRALTEGLESGSDDLVDLISVEFPSHRASDTA